MRKNKFVYLTKHYFAFIGLSIYYFHLSEPFHNRISKLQEILVS